MPSPPLSADLPQALDSVHLKVSDAFAWLVSFQSAFSRETLLMNGEDAGFGLAGRLDAEER
jgi:hypothetical protein